MTEKRCGKPAYYRYTWPGKPEAFCCHEHGKAMTRLAEVIGLQLQMIELDSKNKELCSNIAEDDKP